MRRETQVETLRQLLALRGEDRDQDMLGQVARMPVSNYTDEAIFEAEMATVFRNCPTVAGHAGHVREPGLVWSATGTGFPLSSCVTGKGGYGPS